MWYNVHDFRIYSRDVKPFKHAVLHHAEAFVDLFHLSLNVSHMELNLARRMMDWK